MAGAHEPSVNSVLLVRSAARAVTQLLQSRCGEGCQCCGAGCSGVNALLYELVVEGLAPCGTRLCRRPSTSTSSSHDLAEVPWSAVAEVVIHRCVESRWRVSPRLTTWRLWKKSSSRSVVMLPEGARKLT